MSLVDQIFEQAKLGTAPDPSANPFLQGVALGQHQQALNMELAQLPLKQTLLQQDAQMNALKIQQGLRAKQDDIEADKAFTGLQGAIFDKLNSGDLPGAVTEYAKGISQYPVLAIVDKYKALGGQLEAMQKEQDLAKYRTTIGEARVEAAKGSSLRALPTGVRIDKLLEQEQTNLADAQDPETGDPALVPIIQKRITDLQAQKQIEADKLKVQQDKVVNEADRIKASKERTTAIRANTQALLQRLAGNDRVALTSELRTVDDQPNSKMDYDAKLKEKERILEKYKARAQVQTAPAPQGSVAPPPPASNGSEGRAYIQKDGKTYWVPQEELSNYLESGYSLAPNAR